MRIASLLFGVPTFLALALTALPEAGAAQAGESVGQAESRLSIFGNFTQAAGYSTDLPVAGIPDGVTTDLRNLALQLRYRTGEDGQAIIQLNHSRQGESALATVTPEIEVDWAYYRHRFGDWVVNAGRIPKAMGFYNEVLTVGTVLPLYRPVYGLYPGGGGTIDGIGVARSINLHDWNLNVEAYAGGSGFRFALATPVGPIALDARADPSFGARAWLRSPFDKVQVGLSLLVMNEDDWSMIEDPGYAYLPVFSLRLRHGRFEGTGEILSGRAEFGKMLSYYLQGGAELTDRLSLVVQYESGHMDPPEGPFALPKQEFWRDRIVGLNYTLNPNVVLKLEGHSARGWGFDNYVPTDGPPGTTRFGIASISVGF
jgi:hypothetical protein